MVKIAHNALSTKDKIMRHIDKEIKENTERNTNNTFWQTDINILQIINALFVKQSQKQLIISSHANMSL